MQQLARSENNICMCRGCACAAGVCFCVCVCLLCFSLGISLACRISVYSLSVPLCPLCTSHPSAAVSQGNTKREEEAGGVRKVDSGRSCGIHCHAFSMHLHTLFILTRNSQRVILVGLVGKECVYSTICRPKQTQDLSRAKLKVNVWNHASRWWRES